MEPVSMATYLVMVRIAEKYNDSAIASIRAACKGATPAPIRDGSTLCRFRVSAHTTANEVRARLSEIQGVRVVSLLPSQFDPVVNLRRHWGWLCLAGAWTALYVVSIVVPSNPLEDLSNLQQILLHSAIMIVIVAWVYHNGRKSSRGLSKYASAAVLAAQEAGERAERAARSQGSGRLRG